MKYLIAIALALLTLTAHAKTWVASLKNEAGGLIVLIDGTRDVCRKNQHPVISVASTDPNERRRIYGCWSYDGEAIFIVWDDGEVRQFDPDDFVVNHNHPNYKNNTRNWK